MKSATGSLPALDTAPAHTRGQQLVPAEALPHTVVIVGNTGSGKSATARSAFVEPILANRRRCCIIDPTGVWWGLRFRGDGNPGHPIAIAGGLYGDVELRDYDGAKLAQWVGESNQSIIIDVSEMTIGERHEFGEQFFAALYKHNRRPLHLVIDEADEFAPQNPLPETKRLLHHVDRIVRRGRVRGFRPIMITQRPSVLHKNVMSQATALVAMRLLGSQDRDAVQLWIKGQGDLAAGKEVLNTLARLQTGEGWLWVPGLGILNRGHFHMFLSFDSSRTPKDDEPPVDPPGPFPYQEQFVDLREYMAAEEDAEVTEVSHDSHGHRPASDNELLAADSRGYDRGFQIGFRKGHDAASAALQGSVNGVLKAADEFMRQLRQIGTTLGLDEETPPSTLQVFPKRQAVEEWARENVDPMIEDAERAAIQLKRPNETPGKKRVTTQLNGHAAAAGKLLAGLARYPNRAMKWIEVCVVAGMIHDNGYFYGGRKYLVAEGLIQESAEGVFITNAGVKVAGAMPRHTLDGLLELWCAKLKAPGPEMLRSLAAARGYQLNKAALAAAIGKKPDNGYWYGGIKAMRRAGLVEEEGGIYRLTPVVLNIAKGIT